MAYLLFKAPGMFVYTPCLKSHGPSQEGGFLHPGPERTQREMLVWSMAQWETEKPKTLGFKKAQ